MTDAIDARLSPLMALYLEKRANLVRFFTVRTSSPVEAEDIVQEIYLKIVDLGCASIDNPSAYLYRLGSNLMIDRARARSRSASREGAYIKSVHPSDAPEAVADTPSPEEAWEARARLARVLEAVQTLPPKRKQVFIMHKIDGLSYGEIATVLGISKSAVEKHMSAALQRLADLRQ